MKNDLAINIDGVHDDELDALVDALYVLGDHNPTYNALYQVARHSNLARTCRKSGDIQQAKEHETLANQWYSVLPNELRW